MKALKIRKPDKVKGLHTYCKHCKRIIDSGTCIKTGKRLSTCKTPEKHIFKAIVTVPNTNGKKRKTKEINTRDLNEAIRIKLEFQEELERLDYQSVEVLVVSDEQPKPTLLIECMSLFIGYLNNENVEDHKVKERTKHHIKEVERIFENFCICLKRNRIDHTIVKINQLNDKIVGLYHTFLLEEKQYANKSYNNYIAQMRQFLQWLIDKQNYEIQNPFIGVKKRPERRDKTIVTKREFNTLLDTILPENGMKVFPSGERKNFYRDWVRNAFVFALETGLRREEFITLQFSDVIENEENEPAFFRVENLKVNRILGIEDDEAKKVKFVPITETIKKILVELDYDVYKKSNRFLIAPEDSASRITMKNFVSKSFTHFWKQTGIEKKAQLKNLRKTYLTALVNHFGDKANIISDHASIDIMKEHYVNDEEIVSKVQGFSVFG